MFLDSTSTRSFPIWALVLIIVASVMIVLALVALIISKATGQKYWPTLGNVYWVTLIGWEMTIVYFIAGALCFISIIFIPIGFQYFKFARLAIWPYGYKPVFTSLNGFKLFVNIVWMIFFGWEGALSAYILGGICCITIILWPCGLQLFKFGRLMLMPLGSEIVKIN